MPGKKYILSGGRHLIYLAAATYYVAAATYLSGGRHLIYVAAAN